MATTPQTRSAGDLARELFEAVFERRDFEAARRAWTEDTVDHFLALGFDARGPQELTAFFEELHAAIPDLRMTIENVVEDDRQAAVQWRLQGTFDGEPFQGIEATGRRLDLRGCDVFRFADDDTLATNTIYNDGAEFARQLGLLPPRDSAADRAMLAAFNAATKARRRLRGGRGAATR